VVKAELRKEYQGLSHQELLDTAYDLGFNYEKYSWSCSQCTVAALHELLDIDEVVIKVATSICGGTADQTLGTCGALAGGVIALDYYFGRPLAKMSRREYIQANIDALDAGSEVAQRLADKFIKEHGTFVCGQLQRKLYGRIFCFTEGDGVEKWLEAGAHSAPDKCGHLVGSAARWTLEILLEQEAVKL
jgi:C_GCAxxG_C_C family probable redox protein